MRYPLFMLIIAVALLALQPGQPADAQNEDVFPDYNPTCDEPFDPATVPNGYCGTWRINVANDGVNTNGSATTSSHDNGQIITAPDGSRWFPEGNGQPWDAIGLATNGRQRNNHNGHTYTGNASADHIPLDVYRTYAQDNGYEFALNVASYPTVETRGGNGIYTLYIYTTDNDTRRSVTITAEGIVVAEAYHPETDPACGDSVFCVLTIEGVVVRDGTLNIQFELAGGRQSRVLSALEVIKTGENPNPEDVTLDGNVTPVDAVYVLNRLGEPKDNANATADVNDDGAITVADAEAVIAAIGSTVPQP